MGANIIDVNTVWLTITLNQSFNKSDANTKNEPFFREFVILSLRIHQEQQWNVSLKSQFVTLNRIDSPEHRTVTQDAHLFYS